MIKLTCYLDKVEKEKLTNGIPRNLKAIPHRKVGAILAEEI